MSRLLSVTKGHGTGNDFVIFFDPEGEQNLSSRDIVKLCDRHFGIGADGVIRVIRSAKLPEGQLSLDEEPAAVWFMDYYNADGSIAEMCGNGVRVFARYLLEKKIVELGGGETLSVGTRAGVKDVQTNLAGFAVDMGRWKLESEEVTVRANQLAVARPGLAINLGNPHVVVALADHEELRDLDLTKAPLIDPAPADGANVEFAVPNEPMIKSGVGSISMRVYERGVGETLSCGTGIVATALAIRHWAGPGAPNQWQVTVPGGTLGVRMFATEDGEHVGLSGAAVLVYDTVIDLDAI